MINITLTSSMRSNLSSLKTIQSQMNRTQERLATGKKVNSAIDNASSYYQARSLTNRAADLNALLDSMGQGIQTIQAASTGLEKASEFLEQAAVIAQEAYEAAIIPEKAWFEAKVGENGAAVTTAQELKDAVDAGKEIICVYGKIDYFENETLSLQANQKLVGTEYFTGYTGTKKFSEINFKGAQNTAIRTVSNNLISDLSLNFESNVAVSSFIGGSMNLNNLDLSFERTVLPQSSMHGVISGNADLHGAINIKSDKVGATFALFQQEINICEDATVNINSTNTTWGTAIIYSQSSLNIYGKMNINTSFKNYIGGNPASGNQINIYGSAEIISPNLNLGLDRNKDETTYNSLYIEAGAKINAGSNNLLSNGYVYENNTTSSRVIDYQSLVNSGDFLPSGTSIDWSTWKPLPEISEPKENPYKAQYEKTLTALDELVADTSYQGVNLLNGGDLTITFNESRTHSYTVNGSDMTSTGLGITTRKWVTKQDVLDSINEIKNAVGKIRDEVARLGNSYSIIQTREKFTDNIIDVLETGANNLVLADMNEESADYLALQTRQQLAINSLSLASQAAQSVLKLF